MRAVPAAIGATQAVSFRNNYPNRLWLPLGWPPAPTVKPDLPRIYANISVVWTRASLRGLVSHVSAEQLTQPSQTAFSIGFHGRVLSSLGSSDVES